MFISIAEEIADNVIKSRPHLEAKVPQTFPSAIHFVGKLMDLVLEDETLYMQALECSEQDVNREKTSVMRKIASYGGLLQALHEVLKKANQALNVCTAPRVLINIKTLKENNEVQKSMKYETLGNAKRLSMVKQKCEALTTT